MQNILKIKKYITVLFISLIFIVILTPTKIFAYDNLIVNIPVDVNEPMVVCIENVFTEDVEKQTINRSGNLLLNFDEPGDYVYRVYQNITEEKAEGLYDDTEWLVFVSVTLTAENKLESTISSAKATSIEMKTDKIEFQNRKEPPSEESTQPTTEENPTNETTTPEETSTEEKNTDKVTTRTQENTTQFSQKTAEISTKINKGDKSPKTGDESNLTWYLMSCILTSAAISTIMLYKRRKQ